MILIHLSVPVLLVLPAGRQLPVLAGEHVDEGHEVAVVLVPLEGRGVAADAGHHVLHGRPVEQECLGNGMECGNPDYISWCAGVIQRLRDLQLGLGISSRTLGIGNEA